MSQIKSLSISISKQISFIRIVFYSYLWHFHVFQCFYGNSYCWSVSEQVSQLGFYGIVCNYSCLTLYLQQREMEEIKSEQINLQVQKADKKRQEQEILKKKELKSQSRVHRYQKDQTFKKDQKSKKGNTFIETDTEFIKDLKLMKKDQPVEIPTLNKVINIICCHNKLSEQKYEMVHTTAKKHSRAQKINTNSIKGSNNVSKDCLCPCGCKKATGELMPLCKSQQELPYLGSGVLMQFILNKTIMILLVLVFLVYGVYAMVSNLNGDSAILNKKCQNDTYCKFKIFISNENKSDMLNLHVIQSWLGFLFCFVWVISLQIVKMYGRYKDKQIDKKLKSSADRCIKITGLPAGQYDEKQIQKYVRQIEACGKQQGKKKNKDKNENENENDNKELGSSENRQYQEKDKKLVIKSIIIAYNVSKERQILQKMQKMAKKLNQLLIQNKVQTKKKVKIYKQNKKKFIQNYNELRTKYDEFRLNAEKRKKLAMNTCIVEFSEEKQQKTFLKYFDVLQKVGVIRYYYQGEKSKLLFKGHKVTVERAPEPSDMIWINCQQPYSKRTITIIYVVSIVVVLAIFAALVGLQAVKIYQQSNSSQTSSQYITKLNTLTSLILQFANDGLWQFLQKLLKLENNHTRTEKIVSKMTKLFMFSSFSIIIIPIITDIIMGEKSIYGNTGLTGSSFDYHITLILTTIKNTFTALILFKLFVLLFGFLRYQIIKFLIMGDEDKVSSHGHPAINHFYEPQKYDVAENYMFIILLVMHVAFFCTLQPIILLIGAFVLFAFFCISRIRLYKICQVPALTDRRIFQTAIKLLEYLPVFYGVGNIIISVLENKERQNRQIYFIPSIICIALGIIARINPHQVFDQAIKFFASCTKTKILDFLHQDALNMKKPYEEDSMHGMTPSKMAEGIESTEDKQVREQSYYMKNNLLTLLNFELSLRNYEQSESEEQLKQFCENYCFPDENKNENENADTHMKVSKNQSKGNKKLETIRQEDSHSNMFVENENMKQDYKENEKQNGKEEQQNKNGKYEMEMEMEQKQEQEQQEQQQQQQKQKQNEDEDEDKGNDKQEGEGDVYV